MYLRREWPGGGVGRCAMCVVCLCACVRARVRVYLDRMLVHPRAHAESSCLTHHAWMSLGACDHAGDTPLLYDTRQWYCHDSPGYPLGEIKVGNLGSQIYYARSSNPWIKHECDLVDECGPLSPPMPPASRACLLMHTCPFACRH